MGPNNMYSFLLLNTSEVDLLVDINGVLVVRCR